MVINKPKSMAQTSIFTNMPSLLNPSSSSASWPIALNLPALLNDIEGIEESCTFPRSPCLPFTLPSPVPPTNGPQGGKYCDVLPEIPELALMFDSDSGTLRRRKKAKRKAWLCRHHVRLHYAKGMCKTCYLQNYQLKRAQQLQPNDPPTLGEVNEDFK